MARRRTVRRTSQLISDVAQIDDNGLDTVSLALDLGLETLHFVTVERVGDILSCVSPTISDDAVSCRWTHPTNVNVGHVCC